MSKVVVYGASDDLIEIEGDLREEFYCGGEGKILLITEEEVMEISVDMNTTGYWTAVANFVRGLPLVKIKPRSILTGTDRGDPEDQGLEIEFSSPVVAVYSLDLSNHAV